MCPLTWTFFSFVRKRILSRSCNHLPSTLSSFLPSLGLVLLLFLKMSSLIDTNTFVPFVQGYRRDQARFVSRVSTSTSTVLQALFWYSFFYYLGFSLAFICPFLPLRIVSRTLYTSLRYYTFRSSRFLEVFFLFRYRSFIPSYIGSWNIVVLLTPLGSKEEVRNCTDLMGTFNFLVDLTARGTLDGALLASELFLGLIRVIWSRTSYVVAARNFKPKIWREDVSFENDSSDHF